MRKNPQSQPAPDEQPASPTPQGQPPIERRRGGDRRGLLRPEEGNLFDQAGFQRRRGPGRRLSDFQRAAEEGQLTKEQFLFVMAIESFKRANGVQFPSWTDVLEVVRLLGYRKTMPAELSLTCAEDWQEAWSAPAGVRPARWHQRAQQSLDRDPRTPDTAAPDTDAPQDQRHAA